MASRPCDLAGWTERSEQLSSAPGAYALLIELSRPVAVGSSPSSRRLAAGLYVYLGSARGRGGIRARCRRHLARPERIHWHVDRLTSCADRVRALGFPDGDECALVARLLEVRPISVPIAGFGSSDCARCPAHLLALGRARPRAALASIGAPGAW